MEIVDFDKISLQDYPEKVSAICFTRGCPLRCPYCHNPSLVLPHLFLIDQENKKAEFLVYLGNRKVMLEGVVVSGGEPLIQKGLGEFLAEIKSLGLAVKLDTNGMYPSEMKDLMEKSLVDYVALDYKGFGESFHRAIGVKQMWGSKNLYETWKESLRIIIESKISYELRTTVVKEIHSVREMVAMGEELKKLLPDKKPVWFLQSYENSAKVLNEITFTEKTLSPYKKEEMKEVLAKLKILIPNVCLR